MRDEEGQAGLSFFIPHPSSLIPYCLGQAPVHDLHFAERSHHHVRGLQVTMDDAAAVSEADRLAHLEKHLQQPRAVGALHLFSQGVPRDELHGQEGRAVLERPQGMDRRDAGVRQPRRDLRLAHEAVGVGAGQKYFQGHVTVESQVVSAKDTAHAAAGDLAQHPVTGHCRQIICRRVNTGVGAVGARRATHLICGA
jgi:hypothetical protein